MHRAAREGDLKEVKDLYNQGVPVESRDGDNYTPLHWAARRGRYEVVEYLISRNCDLNPRENLGRTPALLAAYVGWQTQSDVLWLLIRNGADVKCGDSENWTLLHRVSERNWVRLAQHILETVQVDVNVAMANGQTPLMIAARQGCFEVAALLIRSGANVNCIDNRRRTALHYAAKECQILHSKIVDILLAEGCLLNPQDDDGNTPMHTYFYIQQKLLAAGASPNVRNNNNKTGFGFFMDEGNKITVDAIKLFLKQGAFLEDSDYEIISRCDDLKQGPQIIIFGIEWPSATDPLYRALWMLC
ncbi:hypothetical protein JTE90_014359 [Oedothorax gibbosus]|uniref:Uncharacterized protein n=1 Tax=Oedothorax gibbosus TaxID=931172 RepID=A0AAV6UC88_9ARAC|nr:hypothetical protein JTE90_014359 [Oedothorax gibbosus]